MNALAIKDSSIRLNACVLHPGKTLAELAPYLSIFMLPYAILAIAILTIWLSDSFLPWFFFVASVVSAMVLGRVEIIGLFWIVLMIGISVIARQYASYRLSALLVLALLAVLASGHLLPGFNNFLWLNEVQLSEQSHPLKTWLNFDKPAAAFIILISCKDTAKNCLDWKKAISAYLVWLPSIFAIIALGWVVGFVRLDITFPVWAFFWLFVNLVLVCVAEEAIFRGLIQQNILLPIMQPIPALLISSFFFGVLHIYGGVLLALLATIAGGFYGAAVLQKKRIESAILLHFSLNAVHFIFLTYPAAVH